MRTHAERTKDLVSWFRAGRGPSCLCVAENVEPPDITDVARTIGERVLARSEPQIVEFTGLAFGVTYGVGSYKASSFQGVLGHHRDELAPEKQIRFCGPNDSVEAGLEALRPGRKTALRQIPGLRIRL